MRISSIALERSLKQGRDPCPYLANALARLRRHSDAWQTWESDLARGLLDELSARQLRPLTADQRRQEGGLLNQLQATEEQIDRLDTKSVRSKDEDRQLGDLRQRQQILHSSFVALENALEEQYRAFAGRPANLNEVRAALPADAALLA